MWVQLFLNESRKVLWNRSFWITVVGILSLSALVIGLGVREVLQGERFPIGRAGQQMSLMMGLVFVALSGAWMAQEYQWRTLPLLFSRGIGRLAWFAARLLALVLPGLLLIALPSLVTWGYSQAYAGQITSVYFSDVINTTLRVFASQLPYLMLALGLAIWVRSVALASAAPLLTGLLIEPLAATFRPALAEYLPAVLGMQFVQGLGNANEQMAYLGGYALLALVLAALRLRRQDLGG